MPAFLKPERVLGEVNIRGGDKIADFGSGSGFYSVALAERVGESGKVLAFDVVPEACEATRRHTKERGLAGIVEVKRANLELLNATGLASSSVDGVLIANILFQSQDREAIIQEASRILKPGGWLLLVEWISTSPFAPPGIKLLSEKEAEELVTKVMRADVTKRFRPDPHHWAVLFTKQ